MKICVVTPRWAIAGVPLAQRRFAIALARAGHDVELLVGREDPELTVPEIPNVTIIKLRVPSVRYMVRPFARHLRLARPDVVFSAEDHLTGAVLTAAILARSRAKISGSSRVSPFNTYSNTPFTAKWRAKQLLRSVMWRADALTCVSKDMVASYKTIFPNGPHTWAYNIVVDEASRARLKEPVDHPWFVDRSGPLVVAAGGLFPWKGFDDLLSAMSILRDHGKIVRLALLGDGPMRDELTAMVDRLGLSEQVWMPGAVANPLAYFARADVSALTSLAEGLPNVLVEAMMCGCTPVATDCPTGPREVIGADEYGYLVPVRDPAAIAAGIAKALDRPVPRAKLAEAVAPFEESAVIARHFELLGLPTEYASPAAAARDPLGG